MLGCFVERSADCDIRVETLRLLIRTFRAGPEVPDHTMQYIRMRRRWLGVIALATILGIGGLCWLKVRPSAEPVVRGLDAYARGEWERAADLARVRLKSAGDDVAALRLLARASVRLGRDSSAMQIYQRLDPQTV